jgi:hypothetical protein
VTPPVTAQADRVAAGGGELADGLGDGGESLRRICEPADIEGLST